MLESMLERVSAAAREAQESRLQSDADVDAAATALPVEADAEAAPALTGSANARADAASEPPGSATAQQQDEANSSCGVWADTTPFWPLDSHEWLGPCPETPPSADPPPDPAWSWTKPEASAMPSSSASPPHIAAPIARSTDPARRTGWMRPMRPHAVALVAAAVVGLGWSVHDALRPATPPPAFASLDGLPPTSAGRVAAAAVTARGADRGRPALDIAIDADASTESRMLEELARSVGSAGGATDAGIAPRFAIARYDTLPAASADWQVVTTLGTEEVYALVPAGSPMHQLGDLRGRRINVGPDGSARAVSGAALYRALFGASPPKSTSSALPRDDALRQMLAAGEPEAMLVFDGQPSSWFAALPTATRHALRVLRLDPGEPASRRALQRYLPGLLAPGVAEDRPVPTLREVTFLIAPSTASNVAPVLSALCDHLPALRLDGHPKWREVDPALSLPVGLQRPAQLDTALATCALAHPIPSVNRSSS